MTVEDDAPPRDERQRLRVLRNGVVQREAVDCGEPEDQSFYRDWAWVPDALREAYAFGLADAGQPLGQPRAGLAPATVQACAQWLRGLDDDDDPLTFESIASAMVDHFRAAEPPTEQPKPAPNVLRELWPVVGAHLDDIEYLVTAREPHMRKHVMQELTKLRKLLTPR